MSPDASSLPVSPSLVPPTRPRPILGIGAALIDLLAEVPSELVASLGVAAGGMTMVDEAHARRLHAAAGPSLQEFGGSAANSMAIASALGCPVIFHGKIGHDGLGAGIAAALEAQGVTAALVRCATGQTGSCLSLVTEDAQRSMATCLGASSTLTAAELDTDLVAGAGIILIEGYVLDWPDGRAIVETVIGHRTGKLALTLSDARCVERHAAFLQETWRHFDIVFGNAEEMQAHLGCQDIEEVVAAARSLAGGGPLPQTIICTDGAAGARLIDRDDAHHVPAAAARVIDTTGAGDSYAGTILAALHLGHPLPVAGRMAAVVAAQVIRKTAAGSIFSE